MNCQPLSKQIAKATLKQDGDLQSQARIRLSKDELSTDILSRDGGWRMIDDG